MATVTNSGNCTFKAGEAHDSLPDATYTNLIENAEDVVHAATRTDWVTLWGSVSGNAKIVADTVDCLVANYLISNNMALYTSRIEAEDMINVNRDAALRNLSILRDAKVREELGA
jgi:hypothetical protein